MNENMKISLYLQKMQSESLLSKRGNALDLGCGTGADSLALAQMGYDVDSVDSHNDRVQTLKEKIGELNIHAIQVDIRDFNIDREKYSVIICNNVLSFLKNKEEILNMIRKMSDGLVPQGAMYFTVFGPHDGWADNKEMSFLEYEDILKFLNGLPLKIYHRSTEEGYGKKMDDTIKYWHIHRFYCIKK